MSSPSIYVVLVTFNPNVKELFHNISGFYDSINRVILVDNSDVVAIGEQIKSGAKDY